MPCLQILVMGSLIWKLRSKKAGGDSLQTSSTCLTTRSNIKSKSTISWRRTAWLKRTTKLAPVLSQSISSSSTSQTVAASTTEYTLMNLSQPNLYRSLTRSQVVSQSGQARFIEMMTCRIMARVKLTITTIYSSSCSFNVSINSNKWWWLLPLWCSLLQLSNLSLIWIKLTPSLLVRPTLSARFRNLSRAKNRRAPFGRNPLCRSKK